MPAEYVLVESTNPTGAGPREARDNHTPGVIMHSLSMTQQLNTRPMVTPASAPFLTQRCKP
jgi:hypothetical protein